MESTKIKPLLRRVKVDPLKRVILPADLAREMNLKPGDYMNVFITDDGESILYRKVEQG